jgi:O-antigen/teichoic acid export membrane protein
MILLQAPLMAFVWAAFAEALLVAVLLFAVYGWKIGSLSSWKPDFARGKMLLRDSWPLILSGIAIVVYMKIDQDHVGPDDRR